MLALGQVVDCITINDSLVTNVRKHKKITKGRVIGINRINRWFLVEYAGAHGERLREGYSFGDIGRVVFGRKRR
jgi:hypothetical protein